MTTSIGGRHRRLGDGKGRSGWYRPWQENGMEFITLPKAESDKFYKPWRAHALLKAKELDAKGLPGTKMLQEAERLIQTGGK